MHHLLIPPRWGITTALNPQPTGDGKAAINGDFVMTTDEVQHVVQALRAGGVAIVELHQHASTTNLACSTCTSGPTRTPSPSPRRCTARLP